MRSVNHHQLKQLITMSIASQEISIAQGKLLRFPLMVWGYHGQGKTAAAYAAASERNWRSQVLHTSLNDTADLIGRPFDLPGKIPLRHALTGVPLTDAEGAVIYEERTLMNWSTPEWLAQMQQDNQPQILILDELNRAQSRHVLNALLPLLDEGRIHMQFIKPTDFIIATGNPDTGEFSVCDFNDPARISRAGHVHLVPDKEEVLAFLRQQGHAHPGCQALAIKNPAVLGIRKEKPDDIKVEPCPRLYTKISFVVNGLLQRGYSETDLNLFVSAFLGIETATLFSSELRQSFRSLPALAFNGQFLDLFPQPAAQLDSLLALVTNVAESLRLNQVAINGSIVPLFNRGEKINTIIATAHQESFRTFIAALPREMAQNLYRLFTQINNTAAPHHSSWLDQNRPNLARLDASFEGLVGTDLYTKILSTQLA